MMVQMIYLMFCRILIITRHIFSNRSRSVGVLKKTNESCDLYIVELYILLTFTFPPRSFDYDIVEFRLWHRWTTVDILLTVLLHFTLSSSTTGTISWWQLYVQYISIVLRTPNQADTVSSWNRTFDLVYTTQQSNPLHQWETTTSSRSRISNSFHYVA